MSSAHTHRHLLTRVNNAKKKEVYSSIVTSARPFRSKKNQKNQIIKEKKEYHFLCQYIICARKKKKISIIQSIQ